MAFVLDSDAFRALTDGQEAVARRYEAYRAAGFTVWLSAVAAEEAVQGSLAQITLRRKQSNATAESVEIAYALFRETLIAISTLPVLPYTAEAERLFRSFPASVIRVGSNDCRIAASAMTSGLTIVTRNTRDYARIPGALFVDWATGDESAGDVDATGPSVPPNLSQSVV